MVKELAKHYKINKNPKVILYFQPILKDAYFSGKFNLPKDFKTESPVITVNDSIYTNNDFLQYLKAKQRNYMRQQTTVKKVLETEFELFYEQSVLDFREKNLVNENEDFADILKEYKDGLLLFELMEKEIWNKASKDSIGLKNYYNTNKSKYKWEDRVDVVIASAGTKEIAERVKNLIGSGKTVNNIKTILNTDEKQNIIFTSGLFEKYNPKLPEDLEFKKGTSMVYEHNQGFQVYDIKDVLPSGFKTLKEARGTVVNDYQNQIEEQWLEGLRRKYRVDVNNKVLKRIKSKLNN